MFRGEREVDLSRYKIGEVNSFKGFISTSFNSNVALNFAKIKSNKNNFLIKMHAKQGTKGISINGKELGVFSNQEEWLLNNEQKYITKCIDLKNQIIELELIN